MDVLEYANANVHLDYYYYEKISYKYHKGMDVLQYVHVNVYLDHLY